MDGDMMSLAGKIGDSLHIENDCRCLNDSLAPFFGKGEM